MSYYTGGMMQYLFILASFTLVTSGSVNIGFLKGVPRLSNTLYWDNYFSCTTLGQTLQWHVNNSAVDGFSLGIAEVVGGTTSDFNYLTTLLSMTQISQDYFDRTSLLIVSCRDYCYLQVTCTNGSLNTTTNNVETKPDVNSRKNNSFVFLDHVLTQNIVDLDDSKQTSIFVCGVQNMFMTWQINKGGFVDLSFTTNDNFGRDRRTLQDNSTAVKQQGIVIGYEPYTLVTVLIVIDSPEALTVTCGYPQNQVNLSTEEAPSTSNVFPDATSGDSSNLYVNPTTTENTGAYNYAVVFAVPITFVGLLTILVLIVVFIIAICWYKKKTSTTFPLEKRDNQELQIDIKPLNEVNNGGNKSTKDRLENFHYNKLCIGVVYVILVDKEVFDASTTIIKGPEENNDIITTMIDNVFLGKIGKKVVGLIKHDVKSQIATYVKNAIETIFSSARYIVSIGVCNAFSSDVALGDVLISEKILYFEETKQGQKRISKQVKIESSIQKIFCSHPKSTDTQVSHVGIIASFCDISSKEVQKLALENTALGIALLAKDVLNVKISFTKNIPGIAINGVCGHVSKNDNSDCKIMAGQAAFHYIEQVLNGLPDKHDEENSQNVS